MADRRKQVFVTDDEGRWTTCYRMKKGEEGILYYSNKYGLRDTTLVNNRGSDRCGLHAIYSSVRTGTEK